MHIGGSGAAKGALGVARRGTGAVWSALARVCACLPCGITSPPAVGLAIITPLMLAAAVGASAPRPEASAGHAAVTALAAVATPDDSTGPVVVAAPRPPSRFHFADAATIGAPPPAIVVSSPGSLQIPKIALNAYRNAERMMAMAAPQCGVSWNLLAGIGRIESMHANGGATDVYGTPVTPIYGPALDGTLPGNEIIVQTASSNSVVYARAMGPMQFLPGTWTRYASDGDGDGDANPQNLYDSTLAAARYLCSGGLNLRDQSQIMTSVLRYNNSVAYARNVLGWAAAYATGVMPTDLPAINGPVPAIGDAHLEAYTGLGPGLPMNVAGLPPTDPMAQLPLVNTDPANQAPMLPAQQGPLPGPGLPLAPATPCVFLCIGQNPAPAPVLGPVAPGPAPGTQQAVVAPQAPTPGLQPGPLPPA
ncbi:MAG: lytic transglycosylase domain-containing protein [Mycobacterium sp.]